MSKKNKKLTIEELFNMELHEIIRITEERTVMRVPGGWIYRNNDSWSLSPQGTRDVSVAMAESSCFVPEPDTRQL